MPRTCDLPNDVETLKRLLAEKDATLEAIRAQLYSKTVEIERLRLQLAQLRRLKFGRSSEKLDEQIAQLELRLEELEAADAAEPPTQPIPEVTREKPARRPLPPHLPRDPVVHPALPGESGSDSGGERAAAIYSLIGSAKLNGLDPEGYLREVIARIAEHRIKQIDGLLPWNVGALLTPDTELAA